MIGKATKPDEFDFFLLFKVDIEQQVRSPLDPHSGTPFTRQNGVRQVGVA